MVGKACGKDCLVGQSPKGDRMLLHILPDETVFFYGNKNN